MPVCLITGGSGFLGRHLLERLRVEPRPDLKPIAIGRTVPVGWSGADFRRVDFDDPDGLARTVVDLRPSIVFHLAGRTPPATFDDYFRVNLLPTIRLLDALRSTGQPCRVVMLGSAAELGPVPVEDLPVGEDYPCRPVGPYGMSKWLATAAGLAARPPVDVIVARVFNPVGPGLPASQALGRFAEALANGPGPLHLKVGDLDACRDFIDARDVARALLALAAGATPGRIYHLGTGRSRRVGDGLDRLIAWSGRAVTIEADSSTVHQRGPADSRADIRRITGETGWSAEIPWERSLRDLWDDAVERSRSALTDRSPPV